MISGSPLSPQRESLAAVHRGWGLPSDEHVQWLLRQGIEAEAMVHPWPIGAATVRFDRGAFNLDPGGIAALTLRATDRGEIIDLVAWQPRTGELGSWRGLAFHVGELDLAFNPGTYFAGGALRIHKTPLQWLRAGRDGIVIVDHKQTYAMLRHAPRLSFADADHARSVRRWLEPPKPRVELLVEIAARSAA